MIKYLIAHVNTIKVESGTAQVEVLYKNNIAGCYWDKYKPSLELVLFDTREEADHFIREVFDNDKRYLSYGIKVKE